MFSPLVLIIFLLPISVHEFAHAWAADRLGDPTARLAGRKTLNPLAHIDLIGFLAMMLLGFGWARPVPVDLYNLKNPRRDNLLISLAGPASQVALSVILALIYHSVNFIFAPTVAAGYLLSFITGFIQVNLILAFFNLLPFYPLDGFSIVLGVLSEKYARQWEETKNYGLILLMMLILLPNRVISLSTMIELPVNFVYKLLIY